MSTSIGHSSFDSSLSILVVRFKSAMFSLTIGARLEETLKVGKKGVAVIPKKLREAAGISEGSEVKAELLPFGILLRPKVQNPVEALASLPITPRKKMSVETVRRLRESIDKQIRKEI